MPKRKEDVNLSVNIPLALREWVKQQAKEDSRTVTGWLRKLLEDLKDAKK